LTGGNIDAPVLAALLARAARRGRSD
jgi:hypothetical protein